MAGNRRIVVTFVKIVIRQYKMYYRKEKLKRETCVSAMEKQK
jgi:hypothetical protein